MDEATRSAITTALTSEERAGTLNAVINVLSVKYSDKPACIISERLSTDQLPYDTFLLDALGLHYQRELIPRNNDQYQVSVMVAENESRLDWFQQFDDCVRTGVFAGYPDRDIQWYMETKNVGVSPYAVYTAWVSRYVSRNNFSLESLAYLAFVDYLPCPTVNGVQKAVETGCRRYTDLSDLASTHDLDALHTALDALKEEQKHLVSIADESFPEAHTQKKPEQQRTTSNTTEQRARDIYAELC